MRTSRKEKGERKKRVKEDFRCLEHSRIVEAIDKEMPRMWEAITRKLSGKVFWGFLSLFVAILSGLFYYQHMTYEKVNRVEMVVVETRGMVKSTQSALESYMKYNDKRVDRLEGGEK